MGFNKAQSEAIEHGRGPCLVLAGPGSGKTLTIVNRIKYLIEKHKVRPEEILVVTFTRFAAAEMKSRLCKLMGRSDVPVTAGTFHGIYYGILKWAYRLGPDNILSEEEKYRILRSVSQECESEVLEEEDFLRDIAEEIGLVKNNGLKVEQFVSKKCRQDTFRELYAKYEAKRKSLRKLDFDDMLTVCKELFERHPEVLAQWQTKFKYILIDEFQDINRVQYDVIRMLALPGNNLFAVGDDDQAIYGFRGADSEFMFRFSTDYPQAKRILLDVNYRSSGNIVRNSMKVIGHNEKRFEKTFQPVKDKGSCVHVQEVKDPVQEAEYVLGKIKECQEKGIAYTDIAVLYRTNIDARAMSELMMEYQIPFVMKEHLNNIYEHFIAQDISSYFHLSQGEYSRKYFLQIANRPNRFFSRNSMKGGTVTYDSLREYYRDKNWMTDRVDQLEWDMKMIKDKTPYAAIQYIRKHMGYDEFLKDYAAYRKISVEDLFAVLEEIWQNSKGYRTIGDWFEHVERYGEILKEQNCKKNAAEGVNLMTMHAAKGLEFDTVFVIEADEGSSPYKKAVTDEEIEEERRLFYVAMTRAKRKLIISYVKEKNGKDMTPSRFVSELLFDV